MTVVTEVAATEVGAMVAEGEIETTLFSIATALSLLGPMLFLFLKVYTKGDPMPKQQQERRVTLGVKDPITVRAHLPASDYLIPGVV